MYYMAFIYPDMRSHKLELRAPLAEVEEVENSFCVKCY
jgi:hypothetical protein